MSSFDKVVKLACKPKAAPPKAKYLDPIIAATWSEDGAVHDVCKALSPRFREPNAVVVFKALIVLHTMIRNGATDNVLSYLSSSEVLRLQNVSASNWEGYAAPENLQNYAIYLDSRIRAYRDLKHDAVRVQAESNRDMRNSLSIEEDGYRSRSLAGKPAPSTNPTRSKTISGRKLRVMTVEKGLLRETKAVHRMIDTLVECRFYLDDLEDELTISALRMLVKDLLILFQAGNEGVINVLEHYFEMSHVDAQQALNIYQRFCKQTERVVEYLGVARKLQNLLNVPIPHLRHAPVSLAGALQEYLDDPNFEQNRRDYRSNKDSKKSGSSSKSKKADATKSPPPPLPTSSTTATTSTTMPTATVPTDAKGKAPGKVETDFFSALEETTPNPPNNQGVNSGSAFSQQSPAPNPFVQMQMATGQPFMQQQQQSQFAQMAQQAGFLQPQQTAFGQFASNPFGLQPQAPQATGHPSFSSFLPTQPTGFPQSQPQTQQPQQQTGFPQTQQQPSFLRPQATGSNPFRQSMLFPQSTGAAMFGNNGFGGQGTPNNFLAPQGQAFGSAGQSPAPMSAISPSFMSPAAPSNSSMASNLPARPASTPLTSIPSASTNMSPPPAQPVKTHQTGTRNPFGPIITPPPPVPRQLTLMELYMNGGTTNSTHGGQQNQGQGQPQPQQTSLPQQPQQVAPKSQGAFSFESGALAPGGTDISSVASSFAFSKSNDNKATMPGSSTMNGLDLQHTATTATGSMFSDSIFSSMSSQPTGATNITASPPIGGSTALKPQMTGFGGIKPFKPSSSFGASLMESLPPLPNSSPATPSATNGSASINAASTGSQPNSGFGAFGSQNMAASNNFSGTGSSVGVGLRPQMTGGAANPFRASSAGTPAFPGNLSFPPSGTQPSFSSFGGGPTMTNQRTGANLFGTGQPFSSNFASNQQQQQPPGSASLI
ncbi:ANTH domain-containing protein [Infundibulicybe gibba]|nr:ANTH domain-containing protein [Infundibulicybe gibba]